MTIHTYEETVEKTEKRTVDIYICDKCGLEADPYIKLYDNPRLELTPTGQYSVKDRPSKSPKQPLCTFIQDIRSYIELDHDGYVGVCQDCKEEVFGWKE